MKSQNGITRIKVVIIIIVVMVVGAFLLNQIVLMQADKMQAEYESRFHTIYFDTDGGKAIAPIKAETFGSVSNKYAEKDGYIFDCWLLDGQPIDSLKSSVLTKDVTLKAQYIDLRPTSEEIANAQTIDYVTLFKGEETLSYKFFKITGEIVQDAGDNIYHVRMGTSYTNRIQVEIKGKTSEILMVGDIISFTGEYLGNSDYTTVLGSNNKIPIFRVFAENLKVTGHSN